MKRRNVLQMLVTVLQHVVMNTLMVSSASESVSSPFAVLHGGIMVSFLLSLLVCS